jgi:hypothetical protein
VLPRSLSPRACCWLVRMLSNQELYVTSKSIYCPSNILHGACECVSAQMDYTEFLEAIAAITTFTIPNPYMVRAPLMLG